MKCHCIKRVIVALFIGLIFMPPINAFGQDANRGIHRDGYGSLSNEGQDPDEIIQYGQGMMRYGFRETAMSGGSNKYPGYNRDLSDVIVRKLNTEQEVFIKSTETLRQTIYEKELYLKAELVKKSPDTVTALGIQKAISDAKGKFEQKMIEHIIRMKKINLAAD